MVITKNIKNVNAQALSRKDQELRNFLFFLSDIHPLNLEDTMSGALAGKSSWSVIADRIKMARQKDAFARSLRNLYLYIHVPFCTRICTFCHCSKVLLRRHSEIDGFIKSLVRQMMLFSPVYKGMDPEILSFGGGTPSVLNEAEMTAVLNGVDKAFPAVSRKILIEIHPSSWTASKLAALSERGLYRISIGIQSFDEHVLKGVARSQTKEKVLWCLRSSRKAGVPYVNADLLAGLPGQTLKGFINDLKLVLSEGANEIHLQPYTSFSIADLSAWGETFLGFLKRRDAMMKDGEELLLASGFRCKGLGGYIRHENEPVIPEWEYLLPKRAFASFGPYAMGEFPGTVFYWAGAWDSGADLPAVKAFDQDFGYVMSQYAILAAINGLDQKVFQKYFGVSLDDHCKEGLRFLEHNDLIELSNGKWKFSGKWEFQRVREYAALSRVLFGDALLSRLRERFSGLYNPKFDYNNNGNSLFKAYTQNWLMTLYYQKRV